MNAGTADLEQSKAAHESSRLMSLDVLRGFDMFWIIGANSLVAALHRMGDNPVTSFLAYELDHADWEGFHFYDLIFPLFVFIAGVSSVFSLSKMVAASGVQGALKKIAVRSLLLFMLGIFYSGGFTNLWPNFRLLGVLNRIALAYFFGASLFVLLGWRALLGATVGLLAGYWALMTFVPFPDVRPIPGGTAIIAKEAGFTNIAQLKFESTNMVSGVFIKGVNLANYVDQKYLPGLKWDGTWDPEGLLSTLGSVATCLLGIWCGLLLKSSSVNDRKKVTLLLVGGAISVGLGFLWGLQFPVIKKLWTSSYVLVAGGYSAIIAL